MRLALELALGSGADALPSVRDVSQADARTDVRSVPGIGAARVAAGAAPLRDGGRVSCLGVVRTRWGRVVTLTPMAGIVLSLLALLSACAHGRLPAGPGTTPPERPRPAVLRLIGYPLGIASGCPLQGDPPRLLTARHVAVEELWGQRRGLACGWSDPEGRMGSAWMEDYDLRRDLALMRSDRPFERSYRTAASPPAVGDRVRISGYDWENKEDPLRPRVVTVRVLSVVAAHIALSRGGTRGFSGSCVLNEQDQVVGIFHWLVGGGNAFGVASLVTGGWGDVSWMPPRSP